MWKSYGASPSIAPRYPGLVETRHRNSPFYCKTNDQECSAISFPSNTSNSEKGSVNSRAGAAQTLSSCSPDSARSPCFWDLSLGNEKLRLSLPPGFDDALPYHIIPKTAKIIPKITCELRPSLPNKKNPKIKTRIVFMCPITWKDTAVNLPIQMNWLRLVPTAMVHERMMNNCHIQHIGGVNNMNQVFGNESIK